VRLGANTLYTALRDRYFNVTQRLAVTAGGRFNIAQIGLTDEIGNDPGLDGSHVYSRFNPTFGATYKVTPTSPSSAAMRKRTGRPRRSSSAVPIRCGHA